MVYTFCIFTTSERAIAAALLVDVI
jgi:hypothetical protein